MRQRADQGKRRGKQPSGKGDTVREKSRKGGRPPGSSLTTGRKLILIAFGAAFALLLIASLEGILRLTGYGPDLRAFRTVEILGREYWEFNRDISLRYFPPEMAREPGFQRFPAEKAPGTYRVIALGASSTAGDPFGAQSSFSAFLQEMLEDLHPDRTIEVINCGVIAISSTNVLDLLPEVLAREPDAVLLYTGHNEAYGADAVLSGLRGTIGSRWGLKARIALRNSRLGMLVAQTSRNLRRDGGGPKKEFGMDLMEGKVLPRWDRLHQQMLEIYEGNLREMITRSRRAGVDVILCTLVSNLRDQSPLGSRHGPVEPASGSEEWKRLFEEGRRSMESGAWNDARASLERASGLDPHHAETRFRLARSLDRSRTGSPADPAETPDRLQPGSADSSHPTGAPIESPAMEATRSHYTGARDEDVVHFRACADQNTVVREVAQDLAGPDLVLVDLEKDLAAISPDGIPGDEFMTEHVHPFPRGHAFLAERICRTLASSPAGEKLAPWDLSRLRSYEAYLEEMGLSRVDEAAGIWVTVRYKMGKWPFTQAYENDRAEARLRGRMADLTVGWDPITTEVFQEIRADRFPLGYDYGYRHQEIARRALANQNIEQAIREFSLCQRYWGPTAEITTNLAQARLMKGDLRETDSLLTVAERLDPDLARVAFVRGMLYRTQGNPQGARRQFEEYLRREPAGIFANAARQLLRQMPR